MLLRGGDVPVNAWDCFTNDTPSQIIRPRTSVVDKRLLVWGCQNCMPAILLSGRETE